MQKNILNDDDMPPPPPDETIINDIYAPGERNQLLADAWKETHNLRVILQNKQHEKSGK